MLPSPTLLSKASRKALTPKRGNHNFYKGYPAQPPVSSSSNRSRTGGRHTNKGGFVLDQRRGLVVPSMEGFEVSTEPSEVRRRERGSVSEEGNEKRNEF